MFKKKTTKKTYFKNSWLSDSYKEYSDRTARGPRNAQARCCVCKVNFELGNMGSGSLKNHGKGKSHEFTVKETNKIVNFLKPSWKILSSNISSDVSTKDLDTNIHSNSYEHPAALATFRIGDKLCAKIRWVLKYVLSGYSNNACQDTYSKACFLTVKLLKKWNWIPINWNIR